MLRSWHPSFRVWVATAWVGSLWAIGYIAAPTLFAQLPDRTQAGSLAGQLFSVTATFSMACALTLISLLMMANDLEARRRLTALKLAGFMLACTLIGHYGLQPMMAELRALAGPGGVMDSDASGRFATLHGLSSALFMLQSLAGAWLVLRVR